ncbi:hypothetical protein B484DRAFT_405182, partial [Ochromonadaceae sp. CCMP2298]
CQDGFLTEHLVEHAEWNFASLPLDGLKSLVFHGPSPTLCIAQGGVWFDHPMVGKVGCYSRRTVSLLRQTDLGAATFDWNNYDKNFHVCLRLGPGAFAEQMGLPGWRAAFEEFGIP